MMQAIGYLTSGPPSALSLMEVPVPEPGAGQVRVRVGAIGVGLHDRWFLPAEPHFPYPIGIEAAGTVEAVGAGVSDRLVGDRVMFTSSMQPKGGTWAQQAVVVASALVPVPAGLAFETAAALPVAGHVALLALDELALQEGRTLFVAGASGAIGTLVVQLALARGLRVAGSSSPGNHDHLRSLGAELAVDYADPASVEQVRAWSGGGVDGALAIPVDTGRPALATVRDGGRLVTVSGDHVEPERGVVVSQLPHQADTRPGLASLADDITAGRIAVVLERVLPLERGIWALEQTETRHARGKTVLLPG